MQIDPDANAARGARSFIPLDGRLERRNVSPTATAIISLVVAFILFQVIISPLTLVLVLLAQGVAPAALLGDMDRILAENWRALLIANTAGQFLGIGLVAYLFARLHSSRTWAYLRVTASDVRAVSLAVIGILGLIPITQWLGALNEMIPLPEWLEEMETAQRALLEQALLEEVSLFFNLFVLALTPALCEELLFRGYVQRQVERSRGAVAGILFSGIVFGLYHLRISHIVPLTLVGLYLAYVAWQFRSLWPAVAGHFVFNGFAVVVGAYSADAEPANVEDVEITGIPWYLLLGGMVLLVATLAAMRRNSGVEPELVKPDPTQAQMPHE